jgi:hypothetical protein
LSKFVNTEIVKQTKRENRVKVIEYFMNAAQECFKIGNFNSTMAIIASLNMNTITRLKKTVNFFYSNFT